MLLDQLLGSNLGLCLALARESSRRQKRARPATIGKPLVSSSTRGAARARSGHLGAVVGGHQYPVADVGPEMGRIEMVRDGRDRLKLTAHGVPMKPPYEPIRAPSTSGQMPVLNYRTGLSY